MIHQVNIAMHVISGLIALIAGIIAYASTKGEIVHINAGRLFLGLMATVIVTASIGVIFFRDRPFLTLITIQSFYMTASGWRALKYKTDGPGSIDLMLTMMLIGAGSVFLWNLPNANVVWHSSIIYYLFAVLILVSCYDLLRIFNVLVWPNAWLPEHFLKMTSAYTALFSAGSGTVLSSFEPYTQVLAALLGTGLMIGVIWRFRHKFRTTTVPDVGQ